MAIAPVLLERTCDATRSDMEAGEAIRFAAELTQQQGEMFMLARPYYPGCGTRFQWYWGMNCTCPECGRRYDIRMENFKAGKYRVETSDLLANVPT